MMLKRTVVPEELDSLGPDDPSAIRSRRDLQRVHRAMATCSVLTRELGALVGQRAAQASPLRVPEFGARERGYTFVSHQQEVGTGYFDEVTTVIQGGKSSVTALTGSTEEEQFH